MDVTANQWMSMFRNTLTCGSRLPPTTLGGGTENTQEMVRDALKVCSVLKMGYRSCTFVCRSNRGINSILKTLLTCKSFVMRSNLTRRKRACINVELGQFCFYLEG